MCLPTELTNLAARRWKARHWGAVDCTPEDRPNATVGCGIGHGGSVQLRAKAEIMNWQNILSNLSLHYREMSITSSLRRVYNSEELGTNLCKVHKACLHPAGGALKWGNHIVSKNYTDSYHMTQPQHSQVVTQEKSKHIPIQRLNIYSSFICNSQKTRNKPKYSSADKRMSKPW